MIFGEQCSDRRRTIQNPLKLDFSRNAFECPFFNAQVSLGKKNTEVDCKEINILHLFSPYITDIQDSCLLHKTLSC